MGVCYQKGKEQGLWFEVKYYEEILASPTAKEADKRLAKSLLRKCKKLTEKDYQTALSSRGKSTTVGSER